MYDQMSVERLQALRGAPVFDSAGDKIGSVEGLFVDQQTAGGYPIIANIISADLASVGQLRPRDEIRFELVSFEEAETCGAVACGSKT